MQLASADTTLTASSSALTVQTVVDAIATLRNTVDGYNSTVSLESDLETSSSGPLLFASDSNAIAYTRTPSQVRQTHLVNWCQHML